MTHPLRALALATLALTASCKAPSAEALDAAWKDGLVASSFEPVVLVPGVQLYIRGEGLVTETLGYTSVRFEGSHSSGSAIDVVVAADVLSESRLAIFESTWPILCAAGEGEIDATATLEVTSRHSDLVYESAPVTVALSCRETLTPTLTGLDGAVVTLNAPIRFEGSNLLLDGREGATFAEVVGCFTEEDSSGPCTPVGPVEVPVADLDAIARTGGTLSVPPTLVGLRPGDLEGELRLVNRHASGEVTRSEPLAGTVNLLASRLGSVEAEGASLGGIVNFDGAGFVGAIEGAGTEVVLEGVFSPDAGGEDRPVDVILVPRFHSWERLHYVLDEQDSLGQIIDYRSESGTVSGTFTPRFYLDGETVSGTTITSSFRVEPVRQVVWLNLTQSVTDALVTFGLREADELLAERILAVIDTVFAGINVDVRLAPPEDYVLFSVVDVTAIDPNGYGLLGYDNTPGKDDGNARLYDRLGGLNALTQQDGYPGYGGVFFESIWAFSLSPPTSVTPLAGASERFDQAFDPFRPDRGSPATAGEVERYTAASSGAVCDNPQSRDTQLQCAIWTLGTLVGATISHELAHSFGLADPGGPGFHNPSDGARRLMDAGDDRPFVERAALEGPLEHFCQGNYDYLRGILPTGEPDPLPSRSACD